VVRQKAGKKKRIGFMEKRRHTKGKWTRTKKNARWDNATKENLGAPRFSGRRGIQNSADSNGSCAVI